MRRRKKNFAVEKPEQHPDFPVFDGPSYLDVLDDVEAALEPEWYLEIGSRSGTSLARRSCNFIGIDPAFSVSAPVFNASAQMHFMQMTSDAFFASNFLGQLKILPKMAFVDGLHIFDFALRDIMNCEKTMAADGMILVHDVLPYSYDMAEPTYVPGTAWTGDVWKAMLALLDYRPDLTIRMLGARKTGLAIIQGLDAKNTVLDDAYNEVIAQYKELDFKEVGPGFYFDRFTIEDPDAFIADVKSFHS